MLRGPAWQQVESPALVTPCTGRHIDEIVAVKSPLAIVTLIAVIGRLHIVFLGGDIRYLTALSTLANVMTLVATLPRMRRVGKYRFENIT